MTTKYVLVEQQMMSRRYVALRGVSFATEAEAETFRAKQYRPERFFIESRKVKDLDASQTMHCQCCNRPIHAALGTIAHHGYQRPGDGWQTASCFGAKRLPWEVDRGALADLIDHLKEWLLRSEYARAAVSDEIEPVTIHYTGDYDRKTGRCKSETVEVTRATFDAVDPRAVRGRYGEDATFDAYKARDLHFRDRKIEQLRRDLKEMAARYASWKQTHKWNGKLWEAL